MGAADEDSEDMADAAEASLPGRVLCMARPETGWPASGLKRRAEHELPGTGGIAGNAECGGSVRFGRLDGRLVAAIAGAGVLLATGAMLLLWAGASW